VSLPGDDRFTDEGSIARNQFVVVLNSPPDTPTRSEPASSASWVRRCGRDPDILHFSGKVEFRRMIRFQSLLAESGDTLFVVTANPGAISDLLKDARGPRFRRCSSLSKTARSQKT